MSRKLTHARTAGTMDWLKNMDKEFLAGAMAEHVYRGALRDMVTELVQHLESQFRLNQQNYSRATQIQHLLSDTQDSMVQIQAIINDFHERCERKEHTDIGEAWDVFAEITKESQKHG